MMNINTHLQIGGGKVLLFIFFALVSGKMRGQASVEQTLFTSVSADNIAGDTHVSYTTSKGGGTTSPAVYADEIRLYQNASGTGGGSITIKAASGYELNSVTIGSSMATSVAYTLDEETQKSTSHAISAGGKYTVAKINAESVTFYCMGRDTNSRLYVNYLGVSYSETTAFKVAEPSFSVADGATFETSLTVSADCETAGAGIHYTISYTGEMPEDPTELSEEFPSEGLTIDRSARIKAVAVVDGVRSQTVSVTYTKVEPELADMLRAVVFEKGGSFYAAVGAISNGALQAVNVDCVNGKVISATSEDGMKWYVDEAKHTIKSVNGNYVAYSGSGTNLKFQTSVYTWSSDAAGSYWYATDADKAKRTLLYSSVYNYIKANAVSNINQPGYSGSMMFMPFADGYVRSVSGASVSASKFGTVCLPCHVVAGDFSGAEFYSVLGKVMDGDKVSAIALGEPQTELKAGIPYIFKATEDRVVVAYTGDAVTEPGVENGLIGSLTERIEVPEGKYIISGNQVQLCGTGCYINPNRAYLDIDLMSVYVPTAEVNHRIISFDDVTNVDEVNLSADQVVDVYTAGGVCLRRRVNADGATDGLSKGLYIVGNRKVAVTE